MALRSRLNRGKRQKERDLPEDEGGSRHGQEQNESTEVEHDGNDRSNVHEREDTGSSKDNSKDKGGDQDRDNKSETTGRSIASRFRRSKKPAEEKPTDEETEPLNSRFGDRDRDGDRAGDSKDGESRTQGDSGSKTTAGDRHKGADDIAEPDEEAAGEKNQEQNQLEKDLEMGPLRVLQPIRTDPVLQLKARHKKLERLTAEFVPEIHIIGSILSGSGITQEESEGASCRWKVDGGSGWEHLGGELFGQTQVAYPAFSMREAVPFNHPLDLHFAEPGIQTWGSPRLMLQCYRLDVHGRRILAGYGFIHLPTTKGLHRLEVNLWRPTGTSSEEMDSSYLGRVPALLTHEPIYDSAWDERCRLVTVPAGSVYVEMFVMTRFMHKHNSDVK